MRVRVRVGVTVSARIRARVRVRVSGQGQGRHLMSSQHSSSVTPLLHSPCYMPSPDELPAQQQRGAQSGGVLLQRLRAAQVAREC